MVRLQLTGAPHRRSWSPLSQHIAVGLKIARLNGRLDEIERQAGMARVTWNGETFLAKPIEQNPDGSWVMEALQHTGRTVPGTRITVQQNEIVPGSMPAPGQPDTTAAPADTGQAALDAAMAEERKTLVSPADLIAQFQASKKDSPQGDTGAVPPGPTPAPAAAPNSQARGPNLMSIEALKAKLATAAGVVAEVEADISAKADAIIGRRDELKAKSTQAFAPHNSMLDEASKGLDDVTNALTVLSNGGPPLSSGDSSKQ